MAQNESAWHPFVELMHGFMGVSDRIRSTSDKREVMALASALCTYQAAEVGRIVTSRAREPLLLAYLSDGWSRLISDRLVRKGVNECSSIRVTRNARLRHEFLLQRAILRTCDSDGRDSFKIVCCPPIGLRHGCRGVNVFTAARQFMSTLRGLGAEGITLNVYVQDGLLHSVLSRLFAGRHALFYHAGFADAGRAEELRDTDITISIKCSAHGCANSLKKSFRVVPQTKEAVDDLHIVTQSFIRGSIDLYTSLDEFVHHSVKFTTERSGTLPQLEELWGHFIEDGDMLKLAILLDVRCDGDSN